MAFTLGVLTDEISEDLQEAIDIAKSWDIHHIELHSAWGANVCDLSDADLSRALRIVRSSGVTVTVIDALTLRCPLDDEDEYALHMAHMRRAIRRAPLFDTDVVRLFSFWKENEMTDEKWERVFEKLELPIRLAETEGVTIGFENVSSGNIGTSHDLERMFNHFDSPALKLIWDPGNALAAGDDRSAAEGYAKVREHVINVHVKDVGFIDGERHWLPIGAGDVNYVEFFRALKDDGYDGVVALETHYRPESGSRVEGSRESLEGLREAIAEATA